MTRFELESRDRHREPKIWNGDGVDGKRPLDRARCAVGEAVRAVRDGCRADALLRMCWDNNSWHILNGEVLLEAARSGNRDCARAIAEHHRRGEGLTKEAVTLASFAAAKRGDFNIVEILSDTIDMDVACAMSAAHYKIGCAAKDAQFLTRLLATRTPMAYSQMEEVTNILVERYCVGTVDERQRLECELCIMKSVQDCVDDKSWNRRSPTPEFSREDDFKTEHGNDDEIGEKACARQSQ